MSQIFWAMNFVKLYPRFFRTIEDQYAIVHSKGQRAAQVCLLYCIHAIKDSYNKEEMMDMLEIDDNKFHTEIPEPTQEEE